MTPSETNPSEKSAAKVENRNQWIEFALTLIVLAALVLFAYTNLFLDPYLGFSINQNTGKVTDIEQVAADYLEADDRLIQVNGIPTAKINESVQNNPFAQAKEGELLNLVLLRNGQEIEVSYPKPPQSQQQMIRLLSSDWILPIPFFAAGLITILFIRPRTKTRLLLILFFYSYAIWIGAGTISNTGYWHSSLIMRIFIWLSVPIALHLHWYFPQPFKASNKGFTILIYGLFGLFSLFEIFDIMPANTYFIGFLLSLIGSLTLLIIKFFRFVEIRSILRSLLSAYLLAVIPLLTMIILMTIGLAPPKANIALLGLTAIPGFYFFTAYQLHLQRKIRQINLAMRLFTIGVLIEFALNFIIFLLPPTDIDPMSFNFISFLTINFIMITGFGILLIMPALANDQTDLFKTESYTLRLSANRTAVFINYLFFLSPLSLLVLMILPANRNEPFSNSFTTMLITVIFVGISVLLYQKYRNAFERIVLGVKHPPEELIRNYAHRITTSLDLQALANLLKSEVLPSLLIRESALYYFEGQSTVKNLFATGITKDNPQTKRILAEIQTSPEEAFQQKLQQSFPWVQLALPLQIESELLGVWMFGRKDPNDIYDPDFTKDLQSLANQTTLALLNIRQAALLQGLYSANVERQEAQKASVARDLHDVLLPSIGYLVELQSNNCDIAEFEEAVHQVNNMVREIMSGLRPSSLDMGLNIALEELADEPEAQIGGKINIRTDLKAPRVPIAYDKTVELHLYRMVQQASRNALEHAQANSILISGTLLKDAIDLTVQDDGIGFPLEEIPDLGVLIVNRHYGLANIFERAKIINADVKIDSQPNQGTRIHIFWSSNRKE